MKNLNDNQKLIIYGVVIKQTHSYDSALLTLSNNLTLLCPQNCNLIDLKNKNISVLAAIDSFNSKYPIKVLKIKIIE